MKVSSVTNFLYRSSNMCFGKKPIQSLNNNAVRNTLMALSVLGVSMIYKSCNYDEMTEAERERITVVPQKSTDETVLPDTISLETMQDCYNSDEKTEFLLKHLFNMDENKKLSDIKTLEFTVNDKHYTFDNIQTSDNDVLVSGYVRDKNGTQNSVSLTLASQWVKCARNLLMIHSSESTKHDLSEIYQHRWRVGADGKPEARIYERRQNSDYSTYEFRKTNDGFVIKPKTDYVNKIIDEEYKNIKITYIN